MNNSIKIKAESSIGSPHSSHGFAETTGSLALPPCCRCEHSQTFYAHVHQAMHLANLPNGL